MIAHPERNLIRVTLSGFFDPAAFAGFDEARRTAHRKLRCPRNGHDTLVDVRDLKLQPQDIVEAARVMIADRRTRARRLAFVTGDAAIRMQVRRLLNRPGIRYFADLATAETWLAQPVQGYALAG
ncbi:hypothetical protein [uncultured Sphingomonas sp.]|uniref:hypothetical protein n=1 Tax=uncultured Sphingomonas sp. TaxID=158754 RepID=UPI0035CAA5F9